MRDSATWSPVEHLKSQPLPEAWLTDSQALKPLIDSYSSWMTGLKPADQLSGQEGLQALTVAVLADNSPNWVALDQACRREGACLVPLPGFFTDEQLMHLCDEAQVTWLLSDDMERAQRLGFTAVTQIQVGLPLWHRTLRAATVALPKFQKITFTSGTTGQPKGVCLTESEQSATTDSLVQVMGPLSIKRHLCVLPLSVLLENIAGNWVPLALDAMMIVPPVEEAGLTGSSQFDAQRCLNLIEASEAESIILLPQMLFLVLSALKPADTRIRSLKFVAVGGGKVPPMLLQWAKSSGLPVFEGYGLSECASVVCLNTPSESRAGTVGKPLPGLQVKVEADGEIWVKGRSYSGYLHDLKSTVSNPVYVDSTGSRPAIQDWLATGDLGRIDEDGYVIIEGRKKNLIITGYGRNVSPEWPESLLMATGQCVQAMVYGDGLESLRCVIVPRFPMNQEQAMALVQQINTQLPDYAQLNGVVLRQEPFSPSNGLTTANGRLKRDSILQWLAHSHIDGELTA